MTTTIRTKISAPVTAPAIANVQSLDFPLVNVDSPSDLVVALTVDSSSGLVVTLTANFSFKISMINF